MKKLSALTGIRFMAAFYVFIFHMHLIFPLRFLMDSLQAIINKGAIGVNIFFVLSGFILTYTYKDKAGKEVSYKEFITKRLIRIYPAYLIGFIASLIVGLFVSYPFSFLLLLLNITMLESYAPLWAMKWYGSGAWSISTEFFFYFTFPFLIPHLNRLKERGLLTGLAISVLVSSLPAVFHQLYPTNVIVYQLTYSFPPSRLFEFVSGIMAALLVFKYNWRVREWISIVGIGIIAVLFAKWGNDLKGYTITNFIVVPVTIVVLTLCVRADKTVLFRILCSRILVYLGEISYGFYILQIPLLMITNALIGRGYLNERSYWFIPVFFLVNLLVSGLMYKYIEHPVHGYFNNRMKIKKPLHLKRSGL